MKLSSTSRRLAWLALIAAVLSAGLSQACAFAEAADAGAAALDACFAGPRPAYLVGLRYSGLTADETARSADAACDDLGRDRFQKKPGFYYGAANALAGVFSVPTQNISTVIETMLGVGQARKDYERKLAEIGRITDRFERLRRTYELAIAAQGPYDAWATGFIATPGRLLSRSSSRRPGGVCRDFAQLLDWSLMQVNHSPHLSPELARWGGLDDQSFMTELVFDIRSNHAWVDVILPVGSGPGQSFHRMSLDPTWNYDGYVPLYERRTGLSGASRDALLAECHAVADCAHAVAAAHVAASRLPPLLGASLSPAQACKAK